MRHLDNDYEMQFRPTGFVPHFHDTISAIGGWKGIVVITTLIVVFYFGVAYMVIRSRDKREKQKKEAQGKQI